MNLTQRTAVKFEGVHCTLTIERPAPRVVLVRFRGTDVGEFGERPFQEMDIDLRDDEPVELFIDAAGGKAASIDVSNDWAQWLRSQRERLWRIHMLTATRFIELSAALVRRFAGLEDRMRLYTNPDDFFAALATASRGDSGPSSPAGRGQ
jgi:hypothetical protein